MFSYHMWRSPLARMEWTVALAALLTAVLAGCHSSTTPPPPPTLGTATIAWTEHNVSSPTCPSVSPCLSGYVITRDGTEIASVGPGVLAYTDSTSIGSHQYQIYDSYQYAGTGVVTVLRLTVVKVAQ